MTDRQENRLSMYLSFRDYQESYSEIVKSLPYYLENLMIFKNTVTQIQFMAEQQKVSRKGIAEYKNQLKDILIVNIADYARKLTAFAKFNNDPILEQEVKFTEGRMRKKSDITIRNYAQIVYERAQTHLNKLDTYHIKAENQTTLKNAIVAYNSSIGKPRLAQIESSQITSELKNLFQTAESALSKMDIAVEIVRLSQNAFYWGFKNARKVISRGGRRLVLKGLITDARNGEPLKGAVLCFTSEDDNSIIKKYKSTENFFKKTAAKGGFKIKSLPQGIYMVTVKKMGYTEHRESVAIAGDGMIDLHFRLSKN